MDFFRADYKKNRPVPPAAGLETQSYHSAEKQASLLSDVFKTRSIIVGYIQA